MKFFRSLSVALLLSATLVMGGEPSAPPHPLANSTVGEWVLNRSTLTGHDKNTVSFHYRWVDKVDAKSVTLMDQLVAEDGQTGLASASPIVIKLDEKPADDAATATSDAEIIFKNKPLKCQKIDIVVLDGTNKLTTTRWISKEVPIYGIVKTVTFDKDHKEISRTELIDFGKTGGAARTIPTLKDAPVEPKEQKGPKATPDPKGPSETPKDAPKDLPKETPDSKDMPKQHDR
jgi:hypothetical protein